MSFLYFSWDGLIHSEATLPSPITYHIHLGGEALWELSVLSKNPTNCPRVEFESRPLKPPAPPHCTAKIFLATFQGTCNRYERYQWTRSEDGEPNFEKKNQLGILPVLDLFVSTYLCWFAFLAGYSALVRTRWQHQRVWKKVCVFFFLLIFCLSVTSLNRKK